MKSDKLNRRHFMKLAGVAAAACSLQPLTGCAATKVTRKPKTNVVLIMADDIGYEAFGCYGGTSYKTPNVDKLAAKGVKFTHCYAQPLCTPTRVKVMTGQSNIRNYNNFSVLLPEERTFGHMLQDYGYKTMVAGKWQLYGSDHYKDLTIRAKGTLPGDAGFGEWCLWQVETLGQRYWGPKLNVNGTTTTYPSTTFGPDICAEHVIDFIRRQNAADQPFFVYYCMIIPHDPFVKTPDSPDNNYSNAHSNANFEDMAAYTDKLVGRVVQTLEDLGIQDNTLVMFTGDNGTKAGITSIVDGVPVAGDKNDTTDGGTRVPLVATLSGKTAGGKICDDLVDFSDFLPTIAEATGAPLPTTDLNGNPITLDGRSFLPQIMGKKGNSRETMFMYYNGRPTNSRWVRKIARFARDKEWKLYGNGGVGNPRNSNLYYIPNDVTEANPITSANIPAGFTQQQVDAIRAKLQAVIDAMPTNPQKIAPDYPA